MRFLLGGLCLLCLWYVSLLVCVVRVIVSYCFFYVRIVWLFRVFLLLLGGSVCVMLRLCFVWLSCVGFAVFCVLGCFENGLVL